ncbi:response regulator transcription factor [Pseudolysobacter antarcticus]|uniref:Response regulator transcription factor n=1 Tax=Pseudolysobacter antarcticus TaxID=2511995 RepID=A0A411HMJ6_9GAMM|nr:response regulator transcription factor [Pseudolysobacter antarcticus]QBB71703.1 response regulator transcription factor [Pseudolysobacter antarcticus]
MNLPTHNPATTADSVLLIDDDAVFLRVMARALGQRGFTVRTAQNSETALALCRSEAPMHAVLDLKLGEENGLTLIPQLLSVAPDLRILLLTGYASIATAVEAIKRGAHDYLAKPVDADAVTLALRGKNESSLATATTRVPDGAQPLRRLEWEHIQRVLSECDGNISAAARRLGLHRRTLQRKLGKRPVREIDEDAESDVF